MIETGTLLQNRYLIEKQIGAGGMGAVYLAVDERFGSYVAIKETFYKDAELRDAFEREARLLNSLHHPVLPHVSDYFTDSNGLFLVMEFIDGEDLSEIIKRQGAFAVADVLRWMNSLLDALDFLHSQEPPIIHRDIKPHNLKITTRGDVILLDFGLAKLNSDDNSGALSVFGYSRKYSPLEQIQGTGTDARSDIFALGATAYHLLTGKPPIDVLTRAAEIVAGNNDPLQLASQINREVPLDAAQVLNSALALNPAQRFVSAKAARQALDYAVNASSDESAEEAPGQPLAEIQNEAVVLSPVETEDFPALESFADNVKSLPQTDTDNPAETKRISTPAVESLPPVAEETPIVSFDNDNTVGYKTPVKRSNRLWVGAAALTAVLIGVGLSAGYYMNNAEATGESNQSAIVEQIPASNSNIESNSNTESTVIVTSPTAATAAISKVENKKKPEVSSTPVEKAAETLKISEEPPARVAVSETPKPTTPKAQTPRPNNPQPGVSQSAPVPDIESVFTGQTSGDEELRRQREERKQRRLERRDQELLTDDESEDSRRTRRQERRKNRNRPPF